MTNPPVSCSACGSEHLKWRVQRSGYPLPATMREVRWSCRDCGNEWSEPRGPVDRDRELLEIPSPPG